MNKFKRDRVEKRNFGEIYENLSKVYADLAADSHVKDLYKENEVSIDGHSQDLDEWSDWDEVSCSD